MKSPVIALLVLAGAILAPAQTLTTLFDFDGANGQGPSGALVQGLDGNLYGTTAYGGSYDDGTIFKISPDGVLTSLHSFNRTVDGSEPGPALTLAADGNFYGTATRGGANEAGTVFRLTPTGEFETLYNLNSAAIYPYGLVQATDQNLYGTTSYGSECCFATIFRLTLAGEYTTIYTFPSVIAGPNPLIQAINGDLYATTDTQDSEYGFGTVLQMTLAGQPTTIFTFNGTTDGAEPEVLLQATNGKLYGITFEGDEGVFELTTSGVFSVLAPLTNAAGGAPSALIQASDGNLYGATNVGGTDESGTIFRVTLDGTLTVLYNLTEAPYTYAYPALVQATDGNFYGTTYVGGQTIYGTIFKFSTGLGPFITTVPAITKIGHEIRILGTDLTGTTSVTFNGVAAQFKIVSPTQIVASVPIGASTGRVVVTTPSGPLLSNVDFRVARY